MGSRLKNKVAVITGSGRGIGRAIALAFAREGACLVVNDIDLEVAHSVVEEARDLGVEAISGIVDIRDKSGAEALIKSAIDRYGKLDILVNNAGIHSDIALRNITEEDWDKTFDICLKAAFFCSQVTADYMVVQAKKEQQADGQPIARKIINITSGAGIHGNAGQAHYSSAKAGMIGLTKSNAKELARYNILVNAIAPVASTRLLNKVSDEVRKAFLTRLPLGRFGDVDKDIALVCVSTKMR